MADKVFPDSGAVETLQLELQLLCILHHRNKNQHHLQPFFKHLSILKRTLAHLLNCPESEYLVRKLRNVVIPYAWEEFSRVVARGEFVTLGLTLCALTARVGYCLGGVEGVPTTDITMEVMETVKMDEMGELIIREVIEETVLVVEDIAQEREAITPSKSAPAFNVEESVPAEVDIFESKNVEMKADAVESTIGEIRPLSKRRKKKRGDEIDELFAGL